MNVRGRNHPVATECVDSSGLCIRIKFELDPAAGVEVRLTREELRAATVMHRLTATELVARLRAGDWTICYAQHWDRLTVDTVLNTLLAAGVVREREGTGTDANEDQVFEYQWIK